MDKTAGRAKALWASLALADDFGCAIIVFLSDGWMTGGAEVVGEVGFAGSAKANFCQRALRVVGVFRSVWFNFLLPAGRRKGHCWLLESNVDEFEYFASTFQLTMQNIARGAAPDRRSAAIFPRLFRRISRIDNSLKCAIGLPPSNPGRFVLHLINEISRDRIPFFFAIANPDRTKLVFRGKLKRITITFGNWFVGLVFFWSGQVFGSDWPQWRGPDRAAVWTESGILEKIPAAGLKVVWRTAVGLGYSSPVIAEGSVYVSDTELRKPNVREGIHCWQADSGKEIWSYFYETPAPDWFFTEEMGRGPGATPIVAKGKIYALDLFGNVVCLGAKRGNLIWKKDLKQEFQAKETSMDSSPLIEGNCVILMVGGKGGAGIVALDLETGGEVWRALEESVTWSSPIVINAGGVQQLIVWTQQSVSSLNPATGKLYWREETSTGGSPGTAGVSTPVYERNYLLVSGWMLQLEKDRPAARTVWPEAKGVARRILSDTSTGVVLGDYVYGAKSGGEFVCLKADTGEEVWKTNALTEAGSGASIHITDHGVSCFLFNDRGELIQARLNPAGWQEISRTKLIEPTSPFGSRKLAWSAPSFAHKNIYVRNDKELICASLAATSYRSHEGGHK